MNRVRRLVAPLAVLAAVLGTAAPAHAVQSLAYVFLVPCGDSDGVSTLPDVTLPSGRYAVVAAGVCSADTQHTFSYPVGTPCSLPQVGTVPCVSTSVNNLPGALCIIATGTAAVQLCGGPVVSLTDCGPDFHIEVDGQCVSAAVGSFVNHPGGAMTARFTDSRYDDNIGYFVVAVVWTPL